MTTADRDRFAEWIAAHGAALDAAHTLAVGASVALALALVVMGVAR